MRCIGSRGWRSPTGSAWPHGGSPGADGTGEDLTTYNQVRIGMSGWNIRLCSVWMRTGTTGLILGCLLLGLGCDSSKIHAHPALAAHTASDFTELTIIRLKSLFRAHAIPIFLDGQVLVDLRTGRYATLRVDPGTHIGMSVGGSVGAHRMNRIARQPWEEWLAGGHRIEFEAGKRYFFIVEASKIYRTDEETASDLMKIYTRVWPK